MTFLEIRGQGEVYVNKSTLKALANLFQQRRIPSNYRDAWGENRGH